MYKGDKGRDSEGKAEIMAGADGKTEVLEQVVSSIMQFGSIYNYSCSGFNG